MEEIKQKALSGQDNVLIEYLNQQSKYLFTHLCQHSIYECAILRNKTHGIPVFPVFVGEVDVANAVQPAFKKFSIPNVQNIKLPDAPHARSANAQGIINSLR